MYPLHGVTINYFSKKTGMFTKTTQHSLRCHYSFSVAITNYEEGRKENCTVKKNHKTNLQE